MEVGVPDTETHGSPGAKAHDLNESGADDAFVTADVMMSADETGHLVDAIRAMLAEGLRERDRNERNRMSAPDVCQVTGQVTATVAAAPVGGMEAAAAVLWSRFLRFDVADPRWPDRDRFVLSSGRFMPLLRALLRLTGHEDVGARCGHGQHPAIETAVGPPGQGFATAVGMAMAERALAGRFGRTLVDHRTWVLACESDLAAGVSLEAAALAGQMRLDKLVVLFDAHAANDEAMQAGASGGSGPEAMTRFAACGWAVRRVDGSDPEAIAAAIAGALRVRRPTLIACHAGSQPAPAPADHELPHSSDAWLGIGMRGAGARRGWLRRLARHRLRQEFERAGRAVLPATWQQAWTQSWTRSQATQPPGHQPGQPAGLQQELSRMMATPPAPGPVAGTLAAGRQGLALLCGLLPEMVTLHSSAGAGVGGGLPDTLRAMGLADRPARHLACGVQEHGMAALTNGLSLHGGLRPVLGASFVSIDRMRPALRLAALMGQPVIYLLTDDGLALGEDGAGWQPVEQLASLRAMPDVSVFRPADTAEVVACWELALRHTGGPSLIALCPRPLPQTQAQPPAQSSWNGSRPAAGSRIGCARGAYVLSPASGPRQVTLIATGPEVAVALAAQALLEESGVAVAVVSLPCWELFSAQPASYRDDVLGEVPRIGIEAASGFGWERWLGQGGVFIGMDGFGAAASADTLYRHFGITPEAVAARVRRRLGISSHTKLKEED
ncbi:transketolase-like TK C-terminal-containing protein [Lichenicola sp.]|uniref:transketolase-like TK C-terminal-containing protein n=1 Tax=Lichenicola sp. TaxID=2804529 RepID=UPI003AFFB61A